MNNNIFWKSSINHKIEQIGNSQDQNIFLIYGLSGAGKSTFADFLVNYFVEIGHEFYGKVVIQNKDLKYRSIINHFASILAEKGVLNPMFLGLEHLSLSMILNKLNQLISISNNTPSPKVIYFDQIDESSILLRLIGEINAVDKNIKIIITSQAKIEGIEFENILTLNLSSDEYIGNSAQAKGVFLNYLEKSNLNDSIKSDYYIQLEPFFRKHSFLPLYIEQVSKEILRADKRKIKITPKKITNILNQIKIYPSNWSMTRTDFHRKSIESSKKSLFHVDKEFLEIIEVFALLPYGSYSPNLIFDFYEKNKARSIKDNTHFNLTLSRICDQSHYLDYETTSNDLEYRMHNIYKTSLLEAQVIRNPQTLINGIINTCYNYISLYKYNNLILCSNIIFEIKSLYDNGLFRLNKKTNTNILRLASYLAEIRQSLDFEGVFDEHAMINKEVTRIVSESPKLLEKWGSSKKYFIILLAYCDILKNNAKKEKSSTQKLILRSNALKTSSKLLDHLSNKLSIYFLRRLCNIKGSMEKEVHLSKHLEAFSTYDKIIEIIVSRKNLTKDDKYNLVRLHFSLLVMQRDYVIKLQKNKVDNREDLLLAFTDKMFKSVEILKTWLNSNHTNANKLRIGKYKNSIAKTLTEIYIINNDELLIKEASKFIDDAIASKNSYIKEQKIDLSKSLAYSYFTKAKILYRTHQNDESLKFAIKALEFHNSYTKKHYGGYILESRKYYTFLSKIYGESGLFNEEVAFFERGFNTSDNKDEKAKFLKDLNLRIRRVSLLNNSERLILLNNLKIRLSNDNKT